LEGGSAKELQLKSDTRGVRSPTDVKGGKGEVRTVVVEVHAKER
jgi:hypothetical protein